MVGIVKKGVKPHVHILKSDDFEKINEEALKIISKLTSIAAKLLLL
jgi:hypothetical protein